MKQNNTSLPPFRPLASFPNLRGASNSTSYLPQEAGEGLGMGVFAVFNTPLKIILMAIVLFFLTGCEGTLNSLNNISTAQALGKTVLPRFIAHGANPVDVSKVLHEIESGRPTANKWVNSWNNLAADYEKQGQRNMENGNLEDAKYQLLKASVYYRIASYPYPLDAPRKVAFGKSQELFLQAIKFVNNPPKIITLVSETRKITGYFRTPKLNQKTPAVILLPGIDFPKEELFWIEENFLDRGFATLSLDIPGSPGSQWKLHDSSEVMLTKMVNYLSEDSAILPDKIAVVGFNFGGYWALRLAANPNLNLNSIVIVDTPVHYAFKPTHLRQMPRVLADIFREACGVTDYSSMYAVLSTLSLKDKELLSTIKQPVLVLGSEKNLFVPQEDLLIFSRELKRPSTIRLYPGDEFGVVENLQSEVYPLIASWLEKQFEK